MGKIYQDRTRERTVENRLIEGAARLGCMVRKIGTEGWPDRMLLKNGKVFFVETKTTGGVVSPLQKEIIGRLRKAGFYVAIPYTSKDVDEVLKYVHENTK
jgi:hypothetical protein